MFPNPQDALPLPPRPDLEQYEKLATDLVKACKSEDPDAMTHWVQRWLESLARHFVATMTDRKADDVEGFARKKLDTCALTDAQFVIARSHGFLSWPEFAQHLDELANAKSAIAGFESAADAIVEGDLGSLKRLVGEHPDLIRARSPREHRATLLIYVSANGIEGYRQKTPKNIVEIAKFLLDAGAEVDAAADVYGGPWDTLGLVATSAHPRLAGVQLELMDLLIDRGAAIDASPRGSSLVFECLANGCPEAAEHLVKRGAPLDFIAAATLGRLDLVERLFDEEQAQSALAWACLFGQTRVVRFFLERGVDPTAANRDDGQTPLHMAAIGGHPDTLRLLLAHNAPLEVKNMYGGTVLGQTLWSAGHGGDPDTYAEIIETLIAAGAQVHPRHVPVNDHIDELLRRHGSEADPSLWWYGEKPAST